MFSNIIFDLGNVLFRFREEELTRLAIGDHPEKAQIARAVFDREIWDRLDDGSMDDSEAKNAICSKLPESLREAACLVFDGWVENMPPIDGMRALLEELSHLPCRLFLISNISHGFVEQYPSIPPIAETLAYFERCYFSASLRTVKPDPRIFQRVLEENSLDPADCVFIDDSMINIRGAEEVGIHGYLFDGDASKLKSFLVK